MNNKNFRYNGSVWFFGNFDFQTPSDEVVSQIIIPKLNFRCRHKLIHELRRYRNYEGDVFVIIEMEVLKNRKYEIYQDFRVCLFYNHPEFAHNVNLAHKTFAMERWMDGLCANSFRFVITVYKKSRLVCLEEAAYRSAVYAMGRLRLKSLIPPHYEEKLFHKFGQLYDISV